MLERKRKIVREKEKYIAKEKKVAPPPLLSRFEGIASGGIGKGGEKREWARRKGEKKGR